MALSLRLVGRNATTSISSRALHNSSTTLSPHSSKLIMPSVMRLLADFKVSDKDAESIKGTGVRGMLTKGDVLVFLGKAKSPTGSFKQDKRGVSALGGPPSGKSGKATNVSSTPLTADQVRSMILSGLASSSHASQSKQIAATTTSPIHLGKSAFDELLEDYTFKTRIPKPIATSPPKDPFLGLL